MPSLPSIPPKAVVLGALNRSLSRLYDRDRSLLAGDANERAIAHRLALYLETEFPNWDVDCEYNRLGDGDKPKRLKDVEGRLRQAMASLRTSRKAINGTKRRLISDTEGRTVFPDVVVHIRTLRHNLLVLELKKDTNPLGGEVDAAKLDLYLNEPLLTYRFGACIELPTGPHARPPQLSLGDLRESDAT